MDRLNLNGPIASWATSTGSRFCSSGQLVRLNSTTRCYGLLFKRLGKQSTTQSLLHGRCLQFHLIQSGTNPIGKNYSRRTPLSLVATIIPALLLSCHVVSAGKMYIPVKYCSQPDQTRLPDKVAIECRYYISCSQSHRNRCSMVHTMHIV